MINLVIVTLFVLLFCAMLMLFGVFVNIINHLANRGVQLPESVRNILTSIYFWLHK